MVIVSRELAQGLCSSFVVTPGITLVRTGTCVRRFELKPIEAFSLLIPV